MRLGSALAIDRGPISTGAKNGIHGRGKEHGLLAGLQDLSESFGKLAHDFRRAEGDADAI